MTVMEYVFWLFFSNIHLIITIIFLIDGIHKGILIVDPQ